MYKNYDDNKNYEYNSDMEDRVMGEVEEPERETSSQAPKKHRTGARTLALALSCALIGGAAGAYISGSGSSKSTTLLVGTSHGTAVTAVNLSNTDTSKKLSAAEVYASNVNSTVGITTTVSTNYFGYETTSAASGSGFIISADGYIVTNYHVIEDSSEITVSTYDGTSYDAALVGYDESNDLAVLKIDASGLTPVVLGDSDALNVGDDVAAIGNPLGELTFSLTTGCVSALNRTVTIENATMNLIQTDTAINSGNSGGALFNMYGEVIGITNAKYSSSSSSSASVDNIGFAIPINSVKNIVTSIIETGTIEKTYIGVSVSDVPTSVQAYGISGALVQSVTEGSPAETAGLQTGDVIQSVNGTSISGSSDLVSIVTAASEGDQLVLGIYRSGSTMEITVTVASQSASALPETEESESTDSGYGDGYGYSNPFGSYGGGYGNGYGDSYGSGSGSSSGSNNAV